MIRPITKEDKNIFLILAKAFYSSPAVAHTVPTKHHLITFEQLMKDNTYAECYIIEYSGKVVGYALLAKTFSPTHYISILPFQKGPSGSIW